MKKIIAYVHSHWDREWYREFEDFRLRLIEVFDEVLNALKTNELSCFYFDGQTAALEDYLEIYPEKETEIRQLIKQKKLRIGPFYCSADSFLVSGESLYRCLEIGIKKSKELGETDFIGYLSDTFGHSKSIPYILKSFGIDKACLWRGLGDLPADLDWDGIKVTYLIQGYFQDFLNCSLPIDKKAELLKNYIDKIALKSTDNILLPIGADHLAIAKNLNEQVKELNKIYSDYKIEIATPFEYFDKIKKREKVEGEFLDNSKNFILSGVYSSRIYLKQANALAQWLLSRMAEPLQALSRHFFNTKNRQNEIDYAYKTLIKNHAHDSICGCSTDKVHNEIMTRLDKVNSVSNGIIKRTIRDLSADNAPLAVINLSNFDYNGKIIIKTEKNLPKWMNALKIGSKKAFTDKKLYNINEIPITEDITTINEYLIDVKNLKPFSLTQITKDNICSENYLITDKNSIENAYIKLEIKNNAITVTDKQKNEVYSDFISITDRADIGDSYNFGALKGDKPLKAELELFKITRSNKQRAILNLTYKIKIPDISTKKGRSKKTYGHKINVRAILYNQSKYIEFCADWENKSKNHILQIGFSLKEKIYSTVNEDLFGTVERRFNPDYDIYKHLPSPRGIELKTNTSPMQRFMCSQNFALFTKGNSEYEITKKTVNLTLLRATGIISNPDNPSRGTSAGPPIETPELQCLGANRANFAIAFTNDRNSLFKIAEEFYCPYISLFTNYQDTVFFENRTELVYAVKTEDNKLVFRTFDLDKKEIHNLIQPPFSHAIPTPIKIEV